MKNLIFSAKKPWLRIKFSQENDGKCVRNSEENSDFDIKTHVRDVTVSSVL